MNRFNQKPLQLETFYAPVVHLLLFPLYHAGFLTRREAITKLQPYRESRHPDIALGMAMKIHTPHLVAPIGKGPGKWQSAGNANLVFFADSFLQG